jgi:predicted RNase H-like HicB family nuclease
MKPEFGVTVVRSGRWWAIEVPELPGVRSQARRLDQVDAMAREAIALKLSVSEDSFELAIQTDLASLGALEASIEAALEARKAAALAQDAASAAMRRAVAEIRSSGYTSRDAGMLLGVSNQRISQIETQAGERRT